MVGMHLGLGTGAWEEKGKCLDSVLLLLLLV